MATAVQLAPPDPIFESTESALRFALNNGLKSSVPSPLMNRMMADGKAQRITLADGTRVTVTRKRGKPRSEQLRGLEGAGTAGFVLQHLGRLPDAQQLALMGKYLQHTTPCACKSPCCRGYRTNQAYERVLDRMCHHLAVDASLSKKRGKKGLSTAPMLRLTLVQRFFQDDNYRGETLAWIAKRYDVTEQTIIAHKKPIEDYLLKQLSQGMRDIDISLSESGIVGTIL